MQEYTLCVRKGKEFLGSIILYVFLAGSLPDSLPEIPGQLLISQYNQLITLTIPSYARCAGSDGSMPTSGSAGPGFDPRQGGKFSFENFQPRG